MPNGLELPACPRSGAQGVPRSVRGAARPSHGSIFPPSWPGPLPWLACPLACLHLWRRHRWAGSEWLGGQHVVLRGWALRSGQCTARTKAAEDPSTGPVARSVLSSPLSSRAHIRDPEPLRAHLRTPSSSRPPLRQRAAQGGRAEGAMSFRRGSSRDCHDDDTHPRNRRGRHRLRRARPAPHRRRTPTAVHDRSAEMPACTRMQAWRLRQLWCSSRIAVFGDPYAMRAGKA